MGFCTENHMTRGIADDPNWYQTSSMKGLFEIFELRDKKRIEPKLKPKEISNLQVRPLVKPKQ
jgi:hypothetical protein